MHLHHHHDDTTTHDNNDINNSNNAAHGIKMMTELITAYETLMNKHGDGGYNDYLSIIDARDSRVALACETYTLMELRKMHRTLFDIYTFRVNFYCSNDNDDNNNDGGNDYYVTKSYDQSIMNKSTTISMLDPYPILPLNVHPDDSISDLKRYIQARYGEEWGLSIGRDQRVDRDGLYLGWELVYYNNNNNNNSGDDVDNDNDGYRRGSNNKDYGKVLSYHLFLNSYNIKEGDHVHAIVRKRDM
jgi:hypothetical protein